VKFEKLENLLEESEEGDWLTIRTSEEKYHGVLEATREYTTEQRNKLKDIKEEQSKEAAKQYAEDLEPEGEPIKYTIKHPFEDYEIEINPMSGVTHVTLEQEDQKDTEDLYVENTYHTPTEVLNQHINEFELIMPDQSKEEKPKTAY